MNAMIEALLRGLGITKEHIEQTQQVFFGIAQTVQAMQAQLNRIELNTMTLLQRDSVPPTRYDIMPALDRLPPQTREDTEKEAA